MPTAAIYADESGDLGWRFSAPYRSGGSSRFLTISALITPEETRKYPKRLIKKLYRLFEWDTAREIKWADMPITQRKKFAELAVAMKGSHPEIRFQTITVAKQNVDEHITADGNKLYNYMLRLLLVKQMKKFDRVTFVPDERSIKVKSGNSLHDYLQTTLWFDEKVKTQLLTQPRDSSATMNLQFADMLAGACQSFFEDGNDDAWKILSSATDCKKLFFKGSA